MLLTRITLSLNLWLLTRSLPEGTLGTYHKLNFAVEESYREEGDGLLWYAAHTSRTLHVTNERVAIIEAIQQKKHPGMGSYKEWKTIDSEKIYKITHSWRKEDK